MKRRSPLWQVSRGFLGLPNKENAGDNSWLALIFLTSSLHPHPSANAHIHSAKISRVPAAGQYCVGLHCLLLNLLSSKSPQWGASAFFMRIIPFSSPFVPAKIQSWASAYLHPSLVLPGSMEKREGGNSRSQGTPHPLGLISRALW